MLRTSLRLSVLVLVAAPFALGLAACKKDPATADVSGAQIAKVAPPAGKAWTDVIAKSPDGGYVMGNPAAPIKMIEYGSLSCPHCAKLSNEGFAKLSGDYVSSGRVSFEFRSFAIHPIDVPLTMLARCSSDEAFFPLVEQLYTGQTDMMTRAMQGEAKAQEANILPENQRFIAAAEAYGLIDFFAQRGIAADQARACLAKVDTATQIAQQAQTISDGGIDSTPTVLVNGKKLVGPEWPEVEALLQSAGAR